MSIKSIHIFLITCAILLNFLFAFWAYGYSTANGEKIYLTWSVIATVIGLVLVWYGLCFVRKAKQLL